MPPCKHCGKKHLGECWKLTGACFRCGSHEHFQKDCSKNKATSAPQTKRSAPMALKSRGISWIFVEGSS
ncbi:hypothetical protein ACOSQ2_007214 [Xanthoceras sorbifolium]